MQMVYAKVEINKYLVQTFLTARTNQGLDERTTKFLISLHFY